MFSETLERRWTFRKSTFSLPFSPSFHTCSPPPETLTLSLIPISSMEPSSTSADSDEDMETLRRIRSIAGVSASDVDDEYGSDDEDDDLDFLRGLQERFSLPASDLGAASVVKPLDWIAPASSDDEDDLEMLRAIQRRFNQYDTGATKEKSDHLQGTAKAVADDSPVQGTLDRRSCTEDLPHKECTELVVHSHSQFPKFAQNFVDALRRNRACQRFIREKLLEIEAKIEQNKKLRERVKCLMDFQLACKKNENRTAREDPRIKLISIQQPQKVGSNNKVPASFLGPPVNSHVSNYKMVMKRFPVSYTKQRWSNIEKEKLTKGLKQQYQEMLLLNAMNRGSDMEVSIHTDLISAALSNDLEVTPERIRLFLPLVNWDRLVSMYLAGRSGAECESRWLNCEDPLINHSSWTILEDKKLLFIVQERGLYNWIDIAIALGTQRTPFQCLARYQRSLNPHILNKAWTEEEDAKLRAAVESFGESNWQIVASNLEGRVGTQCSNRWRKTLVPDRRKVGKWSVDEDKRLKAAVTLFGAKNWHKIAQFVPGRIHVQCRERWLNCLDPSLNLGAWTEEEDAKLLAAIDEHGRSCWSRIARCVPPRTDNQCRRRWKILRPYEVPLHRQARQLEKSVLISNFVDREIERPSIGPSDFLALPCPPDPQCESATLSKKRKKNTREINQENQKDTFSGKQPKKSRAKSRWSHEEASTETGTECINEIASGDLYLLPSTETGSAQRTRKKASRCGEKLKARRKSSSNNELKKSLVIRSSEETSTEIDPEGINEIAPSDLCPVPGPNVSTAETGGKKKTRKKAPSGNQLEKSRTKSRLSEENPIVIDTEGINGIPPSDLCLAPGGNVNTAGTGVSIRTKKKATDGNQLKKSRTKSRSSCEETPVGTEGINVFASAPGDLCLVPGANVNTAEGRTKKRKKTSSNKPSKEFGVECRQLLEKFMADDLVISSSEIVSTELTLPAVDFGERGNSKVTLQETSSDGLHQRCLEETEYSAVDVFAADDVPLITWLNALTYEARRG
ncbi:myb-like protein L [Iris pallida]|uniref:Myb-like protein L n=1 Tax=Iris pallida TaxID=29817 RepID=A0AAX6DTG5_IRIPA|nr:myb-like protein L [Iris pallida]